MAEVLRFRTPLPPIPSPVSEFDRAYAELIDAYNANKAAQDALTRTLDRLVRATERFDAAKLALDEATA